MEKTTDIFDELQFADLIDARNNEAFINSTMIRPDDEYMKAAQSSDACESLSPDEKEAQDKLFDSFKKKVTLKREQGYEDNDQRSVSDTILFNVADDSSAEPLEHRMVFRIFVKFGLRTTQGKSYLEATVKGHGVILYNIPIKELERGFSVVKRLFAKLRDKLQMLYYIVYYGKEPNYIYKTRLNIFIQIHLQFLRLFTIVNTNQQ
ncbi:hypothetical protein PGB90_000783 [Kerria lacca]